MAGANSRGFDPQEFKDLQRRQWDEDAEGWHRWEGTLNRWFADVTAAMLDLAGLKPGDRVLDIGSGTGEPALSAAERVGPDGYVLATDISPGMLGYARRSAERRGLTNIETLVIDSELSELDAEPFDAVLSRHGVMYAPDPTQSLSAWRRVLHPGRRTVANVFNGMANNGWGSVPISVVRRCANLSPPPPGQPGIFALSGEGELEACFEAAGYREIETQIVQAPLRIASADAYTAFARDAFAGINHLMAHLPREERESIWDEVTEEMRQFEVAGGLEVPCEVRIVSAAW